MSDSTRIEWKRARDLAPARLNPKRHDAKAIESSIVRFGFVDPVVEDGRTGRLVSGHGRREAVLELERRGGPPPRGVQVDPADGAWMIPTLVGWSSANDEEAAALLLAENAIVEAGGWDAVQLGQSIEAVRKSIDLRLLGFSQLKLDVAIEAARAAINVPGADPDAIPAVPVVPTSRLGSLWTLGDHRLLCGDSTKPEDVARLMDGAKADLVFTSPPYADARAYGGTVSTSGSAWDALMVGVFSNLPVADDAQVLVNLGLIHDDGRVVRYWDRWLEWFESREPWRLFGWYVWDKMCPTFRGPDGRLWMSHEWVFHFNARRKLVTEHVPCKVAGLTRGKNGQRARDGTVKKLTTPGVVKSHRPPSSVIQIQRETRNSGPDHVHPARFPVALPEFAMRTWPGATYDPFLGSGSTLIAGERLGVTVYGMEVDPGYCDVVVARWERQTGRKAVRAEAAP